MINLLLSSLFFLISTSGFGQEFKKRVTVEVCSCFEKNKDHSNFNEQLFSECFLQSIANYKDEIEKQIDKNSEVSEYDQGYKFGRQLFFDMQKDLIHECDAYFNFILELREAYLVDMQKNFKEIDSLDITNTENPTMEFILKKGFRHFASQDLDKAEEDFRKCVELNPNFIQINFMLAWVLEKKGNYVEAIKLLEKVYSSTNQQEMILFIELVKRKSLN